MVQKCTCDLPKELSKKKEILREIVLHTKYTGIGLVYLCVGNQKKQETVPIKKKLPLI